MYFLSASNLLWLTAVRNSSVSINCKLGTEKIRMEASLLDTNNRISPFEREKHSPLFIVLPGDVVMLLCGTYMQ
jgi:hypothetical protein